MYKYKGRSERRGARAREHAARATAVGRPVTTRHMHANGFQVSMYRIQDVSAKIGD